MEHREASHPCSDEMTEAGRLVKERSAELVANFTVSHGVTKPIEARSERSGVGVEAVVQHVGVSEVELKSQGAQVRGLNGG